MISSPSSTRYGAQSPALENTPPFRLSSSSTRKGTIPEFVGKLNFYLSAVDDQLKQPADQPSIGLLLCKDKNRIVVEYALRDLSKPIGVASYSLQHTLPTDLSDALPSETEIQQALEHFSNE